MIDALASRLYSTGFADTDFRGDRIKPGTVIVRTVPVPEEVDGVKTAANNRTVRAEHACAHVVVAVSDDLDFGGYLSPKPGDVVKVRPWAVEPLDNASGLGAVEQKHVLFIAHRDGEP